MKYSDDECKRICELTHQYLHWTIYKICNDRNITEETLKPYQTSYYERGELSIPKIYEHLLGHASNKSQGGNAIKKVFGSNWSGIEDHKERWEKLRKITNGFDPKSIMNFGTEANFRIAVANAYDQSEFTGPAEGYIRSIYYIGHFLSQKQFQNGKDVYDYFDAYYEPNPTELINHLLSIKISGKKLLYGLGQGLLRDALKELGYTNFVKPDVHIKDIAVGLNIVQTQNSDAKVAEVVADVAHRGGITPYYLDKFFFLIGSGEVYRKGHEYIRNRLKRDDSISRKNSFIEYVLERVYLPTLEVGQSVALLVSYRDSGLFRGQIGKIIQTEKSSLYEIEFSGNRKLLLYPTEFMMLHNN
ncbi:MAG: hypothetical protein RLP44_10025 [Aggregatilineales bacterium]